MSTTCQKPDPAPFGIPESISSWIEKNLVQNVFKGDLDHLNMAFAKAMTSGVPQFNDWGVVNTDAFLRFLSGFLTWVPSETCNGKLIYNTQCFVYFVFDQPPLNTSPYQNPIDPTSIGQKFLPLSQFLVDFANEIGSWMAKDPYDYATFNELFSRRLKKGMRPISGTSNGDLDLNYNRLITFPADSTFDGAWQIDEQNNVNIKGLDWNIKDIIQEFPAKYAKCFEGGIWMHAFLNTYDYHRQHAPVAGTVKYAKVIQGQAYLQVTVDPVTNRLRPHRSLISPDVQAQSKGDQLAGDLNAPDDAGYQWLQSRGCVIIENDLLGHVAVLPIGMCQVSSVQLAVEAGQVLKKGDEISHFEFGGSDIVLIFQKDAQVQILGAQGVDDDGHATSKQKYLVGMPLGYSTKGLMPQPSPN